MTDPHSGITQLATLLTNNRPATVLTGAGISTDSGIPAYRDQDGQWIHTKPVQAADFYKNEQVRRRYWLRSMLGWPKIESAKPNDSHHALAGLQSNQLIQCLITQNVDNLHQRANSQHVVDLHGNLQTVICLQCHARLSRHEVQKILRSTNPQIICENPVTGPDGDALSANLDDLLQSFTLPHCPDCNGTLKPDVVFFGENVPKERVTYCMNQLRQSGLLICIGTSLTVFSGFRFCRQAAAQNIPIALINQGKTRADDFADCIIDLNCAAALIQLQQQLQ